MGADGRLGPAKHRKLEQRLGFPVAMSIAVRHPWVCAVTPDDQHWWWNRQTDEVELDEDPTHWTSCPGRP